MWMSACVSVLVDGFCEWVSDLGRSGRGFAPPRADDEVRMDTTAMLQYAPPLVSLGSE